MEILSTFENNKIDDVTIPKEKSLLFQNHEKSLNFFTNSTNAIINNSNLKLRILQDIKRRDEIRELYNTHKNREIKINTLNLNFNDSINNVYFKYIYF